MSPLTSFVSRKVMGAVAVFAVIAAALVGVAVTTSAGSSDTTTAVLTPDAQAFDEALADPAVALDGATTPSGQAEPNDPRSALRADLLAAFKLDGEARRAALADIRTKARDGGYGDRVERRADRRQIHHELFFSLLPDNLQADLTELKDAPADQREQLRADIRDKALAGDYGDEVKKAAEQLQALRDG